MVTQSSEASRRTISVTGFMALVFGGQCEWAVQAGRRKGGRDGDEGTTGSEGDKESARRTKEREDERGGIWEEGRGGDGESMECK